MAERQQHLHEFGGKIWNPFQVPVFLGSTPLGNAQCPELAFAAHLPRSRRG